MLDKWGVCACTMDKDQDSRIENSGLKYYTIQKATDIFGLVLLNTSSDVI
jgi:hypothetical protein